jgi:APA family basic amino acid/polyamine antiporter
LTTYTTRPIGLVRATAMVVGIIIGASIFVQPSEITRLVPTVGGMLAVWLVSGVLTLFGALICARLATALPRTGGVYVFLSEAYSPALGFLWGWAMFWSMHSGIVAAIAVVVGRYAGFFVHADERAIAIGAIAAFSIINYLGVRQGSAVQTFFTIVKVAGIVVLLVMIALCGTGFSLSAHPDRLKPVPHWADFILALVAGLFAYGGWHMVTYAAGETRDPEKTIPRALMIGTLIVTASYLALNAAYVHVLPIEKVIASKRIAADVATAVAGPRAAAAVSMLVIVSALGALGGVILAGPRVYFAMAQDGLLFRWLGAVHPRFQTPHRAIMLQAIWSSALVITGTYRQLFTRVVYTEWIFFALMTAGLFRLRLRAWGHPVVPLVFIAATAVIVVTQVIATPIESLTGLMIVLAGLPVYWLWTSRRRADPPRERRGPARARAPREMPLPLQPDVRGP